MSCPWMQQGPLPNLLIFHVEAAFNWFRGWRRTWQAWISFYGSRSAHPYLLIPSLCCRWGWASLQTHDDAILYLMHWWTLFWRSRSHDNGFQATPKTLLPVYRYKIVRPSCWKFLTATDSWVAILIGFLCNANFVLINGESGLVHVGWAWALDSPETLHLFKVEVVPRFMAQV